MEIRTEMEWHRNHNWTEWPVKIENKKKGKAMLMCVCVINIINFNIIACICY